jgi:CRP-like cAMP-binding protein
LNCISIRGASFSFLVTLLIILSKLVPTWQSRINHELIGITYFASSTSTMNIKHFLANIGQHIELDKQEIEYLNSVLIARPFTSGEIIVKSNEPSRFLIFTNSGYLMTYYSDMEGVEHVIQFAAEGWWSGDLYSLSESETTPFSTKGLSNGEALLLPRIATDHLLKNFPKFERYFRVMFHKGLIRQQLRYIEACSTSAEERYLSFIKSYPAILRDVPQKYIASYLGITPEFLSKIRKKLSQKVES